MKPLQPLAMGLVVVVLSAHVHGYDALPDPLGWLLVVAATGRLRADLPRRATVRGLAVAAGVVSVPLWVPHVADRLVDTDPALAWAATLPQLALGGLLAHALSEDAHRAGDRPAARWLAVSRTATIVVALLPVLVFGGGWTAAEPLAPVAAGLAAVLLVVLLVTYAGRPWATTPVSEGPETAAPTRT